MAGKLGEIGKSYRTLSDTELELAKLRRELSEVKMERDILKRRQRSSRRICREERDDRAIESTLSSPNALSTIQGIIEWGLQVAERTALRPAK